MTQGVLTALRTLATYPYADNRDDDNCHCKEEKCHHKLHKLLILNRFKARLAIRRYHLCNGCNTLDHTSVVVAASKVLDHILLLNTLAYCIGKHAFKSVARHKAYLSPLCCQNYSQSVVRLSAADTPLRKEGVGKCKQVVRVYILHHDNSYLSLACCVQ